MNAATDTLFWSSLRAQFYMDNHVINFRANGASPLPSPTLSFFEKGFREMQSLPSEKNKGIEPGGKNLLRTSLAGEINCSSSEIAIMRNCTEALNNAIMGFPFAQGDEVVAPVHEYDSMIAALHHRQLRDGIVVKRIEIPYRPESASQVVAAFANSITENTKMFLVSHMIWISGQIYPVKEICALARRHNIVTVIDAAQSFSHIPVDVKEIGCDYLGASLHKWCTAPVGTGFLYVRKEMIPATYPLVGSYKYLPDDEAIEKFEDTGTITPMFDAAHMSLQFWQQTGLDNKMQRMQWLKEFAAEQLATIPGLQVLTNTNSDDSCGILYFSIKNKSAGEIKKWLWEKYAIAVQAIEEYKNNYVDYKNVNAVGIATPVFILEEEIIQLAKAVRSVNP